MGSREGEVKDDVKVPGGEVGGRLGEMLKKRYVGIGVGGYGDGDC